MPRSAILEWAQKFCDLGRFMERIGGEETEESEFERILVRPVRSSKSRKSEITVLILCLMKVCYSMPI